MLIVMKSTMAGPGGNAYPGERLDIEDRAARELIAGGFAVEAETASIAPPESAVMPKPRKKVGK